VSLVLRRSSAQVLIGSDWGQKMEKRIFTPSVMDENRGPRHDAELGLGPGGVHAEGHTGTDVAHPVLKRPANTNWELDKGLHVQARYIYIHSLKVNLPNPAICHGTLRRDHGHVQRPHIDPISLYKECRSTLVGSV